MDIPLKSKPKVSTVNLLDDTRFQISSFEASNDPDGSFDHGFPDSSNIKPKENTLTGRYESTDMSPGDTYKLTRIYSETEANNFDDETGHRIFDDGKIRPKLSSHTSTAFGNSGFIESGPPRIYSRSHNDCIDEGGVKGLEDEYIPGLDFGDLIYKWNRTPSDQNLSRMGYYNFRDENSFESPSTNTSNTPSSQGSSYLDLKTLHAKVAPQPIKLRGQVNNSGASSKLSLTKLNDILKLRHPTSAHDRQAGQNNASTSTLTDDSSNKHKKQKSNKVSERDSGDVNYEAILNSLPPNFNDLPYSQRKKLIQSYSDSIDYSQFSLFAKNYFSEKENPGFTRNSRTGSSLGSGHSFSNLNRRSRKSSVNTVAGRLLAMSSSVDLQKLHDLKPKENIDEKGAMVMGYELGKIIGFGAWGTIRECFGENETTRAIKIVKSRRDSGISSPSRSSTDLSQHNNSYHRSRSPGIPKHNPNVLRVFKKEIGIWQKLHHDNLLPLIQYLETDDAIFCLTDRIFGGTLFEVVSAWGVYNAGVLNPQGPLEFSIDAQKSRLRQTADFVGQVIDALVYLHEELGIVHGDLKLENVLVDDQNNERVRILLCDFGMSRVYTTRLSRKSSSKLNIPPNKASDTNSLDGLSPESSSMIRSKSSTAAQRKPYAGGDSINSRFLFTDDSKIGLSNFFRNHSIKSADLTPVPSISKDSLANFHESKSKHDSLSTTKGPDANLPHSHIGSLPYASPELLLPSPPPLGPSADIWALGVLMYTMVVGRLPFQHPYEPRLRAMISAGKYNLDDLRKACLTDYVLADREEDDHEGQQKDTSEPVVSSAHDRSFSSATENMERDAQEAKLASAWSRYNRDEFMWLFEIITGCLQVNITKRWDLDMVHRSLIKNSI